MDETMGMMAAAGGATATKEIHRLVPLWLPPPVEPPTRNGATRGPAIQLVR